MNAVCTLPRLHENEQAAMAADFAAAQMAQSVTWASLEWWHPSGMTTSTDQLAAMATQHEEENAALLAVDARVLPFFEWQDAPRGEQHLYTRYPQQGLLRRESDVVVWHDDATPRAAA